MEITLTAEQEAQLAEIAKNAGTDAENFVRGVVLRMLHDGVRFGSSVCALPTFHLGEMTSLHRRDLYDDVG